MASAKRWGDIGVAVEDIGENLKETEERGLVARDGRLNQESPTFRCLGIRDVPSTTSYFAFFSNEIKTYPTTYIFTISRGGKGVR